MSASLETAYQPLVEARNTYKADIEDGKFISQTGHEEIQRLTVEADESQHKLNKSYSDVLNHINAELGLKYCYLSGPPGYI